jgi:hypothetical protein
MTYPTRAGADRKIFGLSSAHRNHCRAKDATETWNALKHSSSKEKVRIVPDDLRGEDSVAELGRPPRGRLLQTMMPREVRALPKVIYYKQPSDFMDAGRWASG